MVPSFHPLLVDGVAAGRIDKAEVSVFLRRNCVS
jgi:hypothetical protein